ncbi:hypothetical protein SPI_01479 [Niveomyces insectorum RCEF 264]|uniref:Uncharacterized protein n=1 Tax=Niveomyces insectorum RCEF 264 TaxID=1081102 RepID=A0A167YZY8_9HYPO|nr:hypothetical protein SPI_01479 [Niveomyces insectorum RCEF 264]
MPRRIVFILWENPWMPKGPTGLVWDTVPHRNRWMTASAPRLRVASSLAAPSATSDAGGTGVRPDALRAPMAPAPHQEK